MGAGVESKQTRHAQKRSDREGSREGQAPFRCPYARAQNASPARQQRQRHVVPQVASFIRVSRQAASFFHRRPPGRREMPEAVPAEGAPSPPRQRTRAALTTALSKVKPPAGARAASTQRSSAAR